MVNFVDALNGREWTHEAACADWPDDRLDDWFTEGTTSQAGQPADTRVKVLELMLVCVQCPVRVPCLEEALTNHPLGGPAVGVWAATTTRERHQVRRMPIAEAVQVLEDGLADRVRSRVDAVKRKHPRAEIPLATL